MYEEQKVYIRHARESDLPALEWNGEFRRYRKIYQRAMQEANHGQRILFVAEVGTEVIGQIFIQLGFDHSKVDDIHSTGYFQSFRIKPAYRNRGVGTQLIRRAEKTLRDRGYSQAVIAVAQENQDALRLYKRLGYSIFDEDPGLWSYVDDEGQVKSVSEPAFLLQKHL
jgi:ribosomal protein S18 acetylase RimI-like enzyme